MLTVASKLHPLRDFMSHEIWIWDTPRTTFPHSDSVFSFVCLFQGRCSRENCKYLHPPPHLKTQLEINGRNNLIQQKNMAMLAQQMQLANAMMPGTQLPPMVRGNTRMNTHQLLPTVRPHTCKSLHRNSSFTVCVALSIFRFVYHQSLSFPTHSLYFMHPFYPQWFNFSVFTLLSSNLQPMFSVTPGLATNASAAAAAAAAAFNPYLSPVSPGLMPQEIMPSTPVLMASSPNCSQVPNAAAAAAQKLLRTDRLEVTYWLILWIFCFGVGIYYVLENHPLLGKKIQENSNKLHIMMYFFRNESGVTQDENEPINRKSAVNKWFNKQKNNTNLYCTCLNCIWKQWIVMLSTIMHSKS